MTTITLEKDWGLANLFIKVGSGGPVTPPSSEGFKPTVESPDTRVIYVSLDGSDSNDGLSEQTPKRTILAGENLMRAGFPDHLLLRGGDWFKGEQFNKNKAGRSIDEPAVLGAYGPQLRPILDGFKWTLGGGASAREYTDIKGIEFYKFTVDPDSPDFVPGTGSGNISAFDNRTYTFFEDCKFHFNQLEIKHLGIHINRCIFYGAYDPESSYGNFNRPSCSHYTPGSIGGYLIVENSVFDHGGWNADVSGAAANIYNHNAYWGWTANCTRHLFRNNIVIRGSSHGIQARFGGTVDNNYFARNAINVLFGTNTSAGGDFPLPCTAINNVIQDPQDMKKGSPISVLSNNVITGMDLVFMGPSQPFKIEQNIISLYDQALNPTSGFPSGINFADELDGDAADGALVDLSTNVLYHFTSATEGDGLGLPDPQRSYKTYFNDVLIPGGFATGNEAYFQGSETIDKLARVLFERERLVWHEELTANAINNHVRAGYGVAGNAVE